MENINVPVELDSSVVDRLRASLPELVAAAERCALWDTDSYNQAADLAKFLSESAKQIEAERKRITQPANESLRATNALFKKMSDPVEAALTLVKGKILRFKQEEARRVAEELEKKKREQVEAALAAAAANQPPPVEDVANLDTIASAAAVSARGDFGSVGTQKRWTHRVTDLKSVPHEYLMLDEKAVKKAIAEGVREIGGIEIYQVELAVVR